MNRKTKKGIETLNKRIQKLRQQLAGARKHADEPGETAQLERELSDAEAQLRKLREE